MAIIYSYPQVKLSNVSANDLMIISDMNADGRPTKSLTLKNLADFVTSTGTGTGTTNKIIKWSDGPAGLLGDSIMTENATQIDLAGTFLSTSSPTATAGPVHAIRADQSTTTGGAFNIALYGDTKHTGATQANSNYGIYTKAEFEGTGGYTGIILGGSFEGRYDGSGANGANASIYGAFSKARVTAASSGDIQYMIANNVTSEMDSGTTTDVEFLQGQHTNVTFNSGNVSGDIAVNILDFDYTAGTLQGDFAYLQIQNDPVPTPVTGTARAINSDSTLPSHFSGDVEIPLIPTANDHATSKQYVDTQIASIPAGLVFKGNWDANTNTPALATGVGTVGNYYVVSVAGNTNLDGITDWEVGDWAVFVEVGGVDKWDKIDQTFVQGAGATGQVTFWNSINAVTGDNDLYWDNVNKRLGIGSTVPQQKLHVFGTTRISGTNNLDIFSDNTAATFNLASGSRGFLFKNLNGDLVTINSSGNVGIGTTTPAAALDVVGRIGLTDSNNNVSVGYQAGDAITTGFGNTVMGYEALSTENTGSRNTAVGWRALKDLNINTAAYNTAFGFSAGENISTGTFNTIIGGLAGDSLTTGSNNIIIGYNAEASSATVSNEITIGGPTSRNIRFPGGLPAYDDDAAAGAGGLLANMLYQTTGSGAAPLNVAGIVMIKQ